MDTGLTSVPYAWRMHDPEDEENDRETKASDVYSLGRTLIFAATASKPRRQHGSGGGAGAVQQRLPETPEALAPLLEKMIQASDENGWCDLEKLAVELGQLEEEFGPKLVRI